MKWQFRSVLMVAGESYVAALTARRSDRLARDAFRDTALQLTRPGERILDFGCGPGIDVGFYVGHGRTVVGYDNDARMTDAFERLCAHELSEGHASVLAGPYESFLNRHVAALRAESLFTLIASNFAPLNLIDDLAPLFRSFASLLAPNGKVLASVLNPTYPRDLRYGWWWRNCLDHLRYGEFAVPGAAGNIWRRSPQRFAEPASPALRLEAVLRGLPPTGRQPLETAGSLGRLSSRYLFLLFGHR